MSDRQDFSLFLTKEDSNKAKMQQLLIFVLINSPKRIYISVTVIASGAASKAKNDKNAKVGIPNRSSDVLYPDSIGLRIDIRLLD
jgi:hypothetical protein